MGNATVPYIDPNVEHVGVRWPRKIGQLFKVYSTD